MFYRTFTHCLMVTDSWNAWVKTQLCVSFGDPCHPPRCIASLSGKIWRSRGSCCWFKILTVLRSVFQSLASCETNLWNPSDFHDSVYFSVSGGPLVYFTFILASLPELSVLQCLCLFGQLWQVWRKDKYITGDSWTIILLNVWLTTQRMNHTHTCPVSWWGESSLSPGSGSGW